MKTRYRCLALIVFLPALSVGAQVFEHLPNYPQPAPGAFTVVGSNLPDGRFIVWNGDTVYIQDGVGSGIFGSAASGYAGDPGFLAMAPDGRTALLGAGFSPRIYLLDTENPVDFVPGTELTVPTHSSGTFLTQDLVLLDRANDTFDGSELIIVDLSASKSAPVIRSAVSKPAPEDKTLVVDKPPFSFSSSVRLDPSGTLLYSMDANLRELRVFSVAALINAFNTATTLDWTTDGTLIGAAGDYFSAGVSGFTASGDLVIGGSEGFLQPGGIQIVDGGTGVVLTVLDPAGTQDYYDVIYNQVTHHMIARSGAGVAYATVGAVAALSAYSRAGLLVLVLCMVMTVACPRRHRKAGR